VTEAIDGLLLTAPHLRRLDGYPAVKVVVDGDRDRNTVAVVSGGGAGHEPAHAALVGANLLAAAVCGEVFASPSVDAVLAAVRAVTGPAGCLLVVKNYTGDRINFGLAAEIARAEGLAVEICVVDDDVAIPDAGKAGKRGLAGTVLVHKVAGHAAAAGGTLAEVLAAAEGAARRTRTMGVALTSCTVPAAASAGRGAGTAERGAAHGMGPGEIEVGMGIHGEPGRERCPARPAHRLAAELLDACRAALPPGARDVVLLVNNLGGLSGLEMGVVTRCAVLHCQRALGLAVARVVSGALCTSLDMAGFSVTLMDVTGAGRAGTLRAVDAGTNAPGWPRAAAAPPSAAAPAALPAGPRAEAAAGGPADSAAPRAALAAAAACRALLASAERLNELDARCGDGDAGTQARLGASAVLSGLASGAISSRSSAALVRGMGMAVRAAMGGTSGALYAIGLLEAARHLESPGGAGDFVGALAAAVARVALHGGAEEGDRTMLDALGPAARAMRERAGRGAGAGEVARAGAEAAAAGAGRTRGMRARAGRASYVPADAWRDEDPGAEAASLWLRAVSDSLAA